MWVERHDLQGNLDIQPPINRCNQLDFCPSRAVAFQCPETSNRHKWQVESYLGCLLKIWGDLKWKIHNIHKFDGQKSVMDIISLYIYTYHNIPMPLILQQKNMVIFFGWGPSEMLRSRSSFQGSLYGEIVAGILLTPWVTACFVCVFVVELCQS